MLLFLLPLLFLNGATGKTQRTHANTCPPRLMQRNDWFYLQVRGDFCYRFETTHAKVYSDANRDCIKDGGTLALPKSQEVNDWLARTLLNYIRSDKPAWIGLHDKKDETIFVWEDHEKMEWSNFARDNGPDNSLTQTGVEDCVALHPTDGKWHDYQCGGGFIGTVFSWLTRSSTKKHYICQYTTELSDEESSSPKKKDVKDNGDGDAKDDSNTTEKKDSKSEGNKGSMENSKDYTVDSNSNTDPTENNPNDDSGAGPANKTAKDADNGDDTVIDESGSELAEGECPAFDCTLDCGFYGYKTGPDGCAICECPDVPGLPSS